MATQEREMAGTDDKALSRKMCDRGHEVAKQIEDLCKTYAKELLEDKHPAGADFFTKEAERWSKRRATWYPTKASKIEALEKELAALKSKK